MAGRWTQKEKEFLENNYGPMTGQQIADALGRSIHSIREAIQKRGLSSPRQDYMPWELDLIMQNWNDESKRERVCAILKRDKRSCSNKFYSELRRRARQNLKNT